MLDCVPLDNLAASIFDSLQCLCPARSCGTGGSTVFCISSMVWAYLSSIFAAGCRAAALGAAGAAEGRWAAMPDPLVCGLNKMLLGCTYVRLW